MDSEGSETMAPRQLRSSTRSIPAKAKAVNFEPTPRGPLKRTKTSSKQQSPNKVLAVNGSKDGDDVSDDEESPSKKSRLQTGEGLASGDEDGDAVNMDTQEPLETVGKNEGQGINTVKNPTKHPPQPNIYQGPLGDFSLNPQVALGQRCPYIRPESENVIKHKKVEEPKKDFAPPSKCTTQIKNVPVTSMADYKRKMEAKIPEKKKVNHHVPSRYPMSETTTTTRQRMTDSSSQKRSVPEKKQVGTKKTAVSSQSSRHTSKGLWYVGLMLLSIGLFLAFKSLPTLQGTRDSSEHQSGSLNSGLFVDELSRLEMNYPGQQPELWKRSKIHLLKHLTTSHPTEPVSLMLTAGVKAERTLHCLAHSLASAFSLSLNASVLHIDGASKTGQDSDQVKLDIDNQLRAAFEGDKPVAVIDRFEELPPGSTIIFYRYCDHENAAFKRGFFLFTVLLSKEDLSTQHSLKEVEEMVRDYVKERFVGNETAFNKMNADKFSGLWSRISHLILPVAYEDDIEQSGC